MSCWVANSYSTNNLAMVEGVDLSGVTGNPGTNQGIRWEWNWLHLSIHTNMKRIGPRKICDTYFDISLYSEKLNPVPTFTDQEYQACLFITTSFFQNFIHFLGCFV